MSQIGVDISFGSAEPMSGSVEEISGRITLLSVLNTKLQAHELGGDLAAGSPLSIKFRSEHSEQCPMLRGVIVGGSRTPALTFIAVEILDWQKLASYWRALEHRSPRRPDGGSAARRRHTLD